MNKASRILLAVCLGLGLALVLVTGVVLALGLTTSGTAWVLERISNSVNSAPGSTVQWRTAEGTLLSGLDVRDFSYVTTTESGPLTITIPHFSFSWQPLGLLKYALVIEPLQIDGLSYVAEGIAQESEPLTADALRELLFNLPVSIELRQIAIRNFSGRRNDSSFVLTALSGSAALNSQRIQLTGLQLQQEGASVSGQLQLDNTLAAEGTLVWHTRIAETDYSGELDISGNLQELQLSHMLTQPLQVNSSGVVAPGVLAGPELSLDMRHTFGLLDLAAFGQDGVVLEQGDIRTTGSPAALSITGILQARVQDLEPLVLNLDLRYQPEQLTINAVHLVSSQIDLTGMGGLQFTPLALQLDWTLANLDPGAAVPDIRLREVSGEGSVVLNSPPEGVQVSIVINRIEGLLNDLPLAISGMLDIAEAQLPAVDLQMRSGANTFSVSGSAAQALALDWQLQAPQLRQLWQGLEGELSGRGSIQGTLALPEVNGRLDGQQLRLQRPDGAISLRSFGLQATASTAGNDIRLNIGALAMSGASGTVTPVLEQGTLTLTGTPAQHALSAELALADANLMLELNGALDAGAWQGRLQTSRVSGGYGNWQQEAAVAMTYANDAFSVGETCWNYVLIQLCLDGAQGAGAGLNANLALRNVPLAWLDAAAVASGQGLTPKPPLLQELQDAKGYSLPPGLQAEGDVDVQLALVNLSGASWDSLAIDIVPENIVLQVGFADDSVNDGDPPPVQRFGFNVDTLHASNTAGAWGAELNMRIVRQTPTGDQMQGNLSARLSMDANEVLGGDVAFGFNDLAWLETLAPVLREPYGTFNGNVAVAGTMSSPLLNGQLRLANAGFAVPDYGLVLTNLELTLRNLANNDFFLEGRASSGEGSVALTTTLSKLSSAERTVTAEITGTDFGVIDTAYARANISPQLQLSFANSELTVTGGIILPLLDIDLEAMFATVDRNGVDVSRDVVVINATEQDAVASVSQTVSVPLHADVSLLLGEDVRLRGYGLNTRLDGELSLEQSPNRPVLVYGELGIPEGSFEIYNQVLNAKDGRLMFFGNPANPVVDIRAFRETNDAEVGMLLSGSIKDMQGTLYSSPDLPDNEILALLVTGKSFNNINDQEGNALLGAIASFGFDRSEGLTSKVSSKLGFDSFTVESGSTLEESALGLGKYITPDLLMRYKVGLFDRQSALSIDYNLTSRIKLQVETGISQSVDISYTIETD